MSNPVVELKQYSTEEGWSPDGTTIMTGGHGAKGMAENESLDLWDRHSGRWRQLLKKIHSHEPVEEIADEVVRCLYKTSQNLVELLPLHELLDATELGSDRVCEVVRRCRKGRDYDLAASTVSCVHYPVRGKAKQCGCCPACIGRRQAMIGAGIVESDGAYECDLFGESHITNAVSAEKLLPLKATLMQVERLGKLREQSLPEWFLRYALGTRVAENPASLRGWVDVLLRYRAEWLDLVAFGQSKGWAWARWLPASCAA